MASRELGWLGSKETDPGSQYRATQEETLQKSQGHQEKLFLLVWLLLFCF